MGHWFWNAIYLPSCPPTQIDRGLRGGRLDGCIQTSQERVQGLLGDGNSDLVWLPNWPPCPGGFVHREIIGIADGRPKSAVWAGRLATKES